MKRFAVWAVIISLAALSGCVSAPPETAVPELTFEQMQPIALNVAKIEVFDEYAPPMKDPNIEHLMPTPPAVAAKNLAEKKLLAEGADRLLRVVIEKAAVTKESLPVTQGFWGAFSLEPAERYKANLSLRFELVKEEAPDIIIGHASVTGNRTKTLAEGASPADRDRAMTELTEGLMADLYDGFNTVVRGTFGKM